MVVYLHSQLSTTIISCSFTLFTWNNMHMNYANTVWLLLSFTMSKNCNAQNKTVILIFMCLNGHFFMHNFYLYIRGALITITAHIYYIIM